MRDRLHRSVEQALVVADHQRRAGELRQPRLKPHRRLEVEMVGRLVQQQQVGGGEQHGRQRHAHAPAAGERRDGAGLRVGVEAEAGQDGRRPRGRRVRADRAQPLVDRAHAVQARVRVQLGEQRQALGVAGEHGVQQRLGAGRRLLPDLRHAGAGRDADLPAVDREVAGDGAQQGGLAGAVAADEADAAAWVDGQVRPFEQGAAADPQRDAGDREQAHVGARSVVQVRRRGMARAGPAWNRAPGKAPGGIRAPSVESGRRVARTAAPSNGLRGRHV